MQKKSMPAYINALENLQKAPRNIKLGLSRMRMLLNVLDNPHKNYKILHVAGSNGKGSTCAFLDSMCRESGLRCGRFISPHLSSARERIVISDQMISECNFVSLENKVSNAILTLNSIDAPSFFERIVAMALLAFRQAQVEVAVLEVGLGGRLDATNVVTPVACGISNISLDHTNILGDTIAQIAREKAGIIKPNVPIVTIAQNEQAISEIKKIAFEKNAPFIVAKSLKISQFEIEPALNGKFQANNLALAVQMLDSCNLATDFSAQKRGANNTCWPGRYELVKNDPKVLLDGAHNPAAIKALITALSQDKRFANKPLFVVLGMTRSHNSQAFAQSWLDASFGQLPQKLIITQSRIPRSKDPSDFIDDFVTLGFDSKIVLQPFEALNMALGLAEKSHGYVLITGSLYLVGELRARFFDIPVDPILPLY